MKIFISYSWDDEDNKRWVVKLVNDLRSIYGFDAKCDTISGDGELNSMIVDGVTKSDKVIVVVTPQYTYKANNRIGGVGKETKLLYNRFFKDDKSIIPIMKEQANMPDYLNAVPYLDFTTGNYEENLNQLAKRLQNKTEYEASKITNSPINAYDEDLIPDLRINDANAESEFLKLEFRAADDRLQSLLKSTKQKYSSFNYKRSEKVDIVKSNSSTYVNGLWVNKQNEYLVITYKVMLNDKSGFVRFWLSCNDSSFGKGIFGSYDDYSYPKPYNSYNFIATLDKTGSKLSLYVNFIFADKPIKTGKELGEYLYKTLMERIK